MQAGLAIQKAQSSSAGGLQAERMAAIGDVLKPRADSHHSIQKHSPGLFAAARTWWWKEMGLRSNNLQQSQLAGRRGAQQSGKKIVQPHPQFLAYSKERETRLKLVNPRKIIEESA